MKVNKKNLNFILTSTESSINTFIKWLEFIKEYYFDESFPCCFNNGRYLNKYIFYNSCICPKSLKEINIISEKTLFVGSIIKEYENNGDIWEAVRKNNVKFNKLISILKTNEV